MQSKKIRVFLVHAVQDKPTVRELYARLKSEPWIDPWFDEENLLPGQNWDLEIQKTLRQIDAIIICLSKVSVAKEGYIQKEIKRALDICDEKPEGTIYIIPLRLDDCEIPSRLKVFHWVDYFNKNYDQKLIAALKTRADSLGIQTTKAQPPTPAKPVAPQDFTPGGRPIYKLAEMDFVKVTAGAFFMGSNDGRDDEKPQHYLQLDYDYYIGRFPVTNQDWAKFMFDKRETPIFPPEKLRHPVVNVSWNDAQEYIAWLNKKYQSELTGFVGASHDSPRSKAERDDLPLLFRLPSEAEWEKAARGVEGNIYPWGNTFDKNKCNSSESGIGDTTPVGKYSPQGDSAFGCADMIGNVDEWTRSLWGSDAEVSYFKYPYRLRDGREDENNNDMFRVLRGVSYVSPGMRGYCANRYSYPPDGADEETGFRVIVSSFLA